MSGLIASPDPLILSPSAVTLIQGGEPAQILIAARPGLPISLCGAPVGITAALLTSAGNASVRLNATSAARGEPASVLLVQRDATSYSAALLGIDVRGTAGAPDTSFGNNGVARPGPDDNAWIEAVRMSGDSIFVAGTDSPGFNDCPAPGYSVFVEKRDRNGKVDASFGSAGRFYACTPLDVTDLLIDDDRLLVVTRESGGPSIYAADLASGVPLISFGDHGKIKVTSDGNGNSEWLMSGHRTADGFVFLHRLDEFQAFLLFVRDDGSYSQVALQNSGDMASDLLMRPHSGAQEGGYLVQNNSRLLAYDRFGALDTSFGFQGSIPSQRSANGWAASSGAILMSDGRILTRAGGRYLARFDENGVPDESFGPQGYKQIEEMFSDPFIEIFPISSGFVATAYGSVTSTTVTARLRKFDSDGSFDLGWGTQGILAGDTYPVVADVLEDDAGGIVVGGSSWAHRYLMRIWP